MPALPPPHTGARFVLVRAAVSDEAVTYRTEILFHDATYAGRLLIALPDGACRLEPETLPSGEPLPAWATRFLLLLGRQVVRHRGQLGGSEPGGWPYRLSRWHAAPAAEPATGPHP